MNLAELKRAGACPHCFDGSRSYHWSGAGIEPGEILAAGSELLEMTFDEYRMPATARARCEQCDVVWVLEYRWVDRPPLLLTARIE